MQPIGSDLRPISRDEFRKLYSPLALRVHRLLSIPGVRQRFQWYRSRQPYRNDWRFPPADLVSLADKYIWLGVIHDRCCCPNEPVFGRDARNEAVEATTILSLWPYGEKQRRQYLQILGSYLRDVEADLRAAGERKMVATEKGAAFRPSGEYLRQVGSWVAERVPPASSQREWFRERLIEAVAIERQHYEWSMARQKGEAERLCRRRKRRHYESVKANSRLRDRESGPPQDHPDWTWQEWLVEGGSEQERPIEGWGPPDLREEAGPPSLIPSLLDRQRREPGHLLAWRCFLLAVIHDATPGYESSRLVDDLDLPPLLEYLRRCVQRLTLVGSLATTDTPFRDHGSATAPRLDALNRDEIDAARPAVEAELAAIHTKKAETDAAGGEVEMDLATSGHTDGSRVSAKEKPWADGTPSAPGVMVPDDATLSVDKLAEIFGVEKEALRKRLERLRRKDHTCFVEVADRASTEAQFIYKVGKVRPVIEALKTSGKTSGKRPAKKNSP